MRKARPMTGVEQLADSEHQQLADDLQSIASAIE
jgi:hypothetical protein